MSLSNNRFNEDRPSHVRGQFHYSVLRVAMNKSATIPPKQRHTKRHMRWGRIAGAVLTLGLTGYLTVQGISALLAPPSSFDGVIPASAPLAIEGTYADVSNFLTKLADPSLLQGLQTTLPANCELKSPASQESLLFAVLPTASSAADSQACQANLSRIAATVEDAWNEQEQYPSKLASAPPCPAHGQIYYKSDGQSFSLMCKSAGHVTTYDSENGLSQQVSHDPTRRFLSIFPEQDSQTNVTLGEQFYKLQANSDNPQAAQTFLGAVTEDNGLDLEKDSPLAHSTMRLTCSAEEFNALRSAGKLTLPLQLPAGSTLRAWYRSSDGRISLRLHWPEVQNLKGLASSAQELLELLPQAPTALCAPLSLLEKLDLIPEQFQNQQTATPDLAGLALDNSQAGFPAVLQALNLERPATIVSGFTEPTSLQAWLTQSPWGDLSALNQDSEADCQLSTQDNSAILQIGSKPSYDFTAPSLPSGPSTPCAAGWVTCAPQNESDSNVTKTYAFTAGAVADTLWVEAQILQP